MSDVPKPLAPVCGKPFLMYLVENCISQGANDLIFLLHFEAQKIENMLLDMTSRGLLKGVLIRTLTEKAALGTGGAILNAVHNFEFENSFLVINADTWLGTGLRLMDESESPSLAAVKVKNCSRYGALLISDGRVNQFKEKDLSLKDGWINAGSYHLHPKDLLVGGYGTCFSLEEKVLPRLVDEQNLAVVPIETEFIDIGVPEDYFRFCDWIERGKNSDL